LQISQRSLIIIESRGTVRSTGRIQALAHTLVVAMLINSPCGASGNNNRFSSVIVLELRYVSVSVFLPTNKVIVDINVKGICLPSIRSSCEPGAGSLVVELGGYIGAVVIPKDPVVAAGNIVDIVVLISIQKPDASHTQRFNTIVKVLAP
jgi:hypothetical protein